MVAKDKDSAKQYWIWELQSGRMTIDALNEILEYISDRVKRTEARGMKYADEGYKYMAQAIAQHEFLKSARGYDYIKRGSIPHHFRRLSLDFAEGVVDIHQSEYHLKIFDKDKVDIFAGGPPGTGINLNVVRDVGGIKNKYIFDGTIFADGRMLKDTAFGVGRIAVKNGIPMHEVKSVLRWISKNDNFSNENYDTIEGENQGDIEYLHYFNAKGNEFVPFSEMYIVDKENNDRVIAYTKEEDGYVRIYDGQHNPLDFVLSTDEAKEPRGGSGSFQIKEGQVSTDRLKIPGEARRIVKIPPQRAKDSAAFPFVLVELMSDPEFAGLREVLTSYLKSIVRNYVSPLIESRVNDVVAADMVGALIGENAGFTSETQDLLDPEGTGLISGSGFHHPHIMQGFEDPMKNKMIIQGAFKGRIKGYGNVVTLKADTNNMVRSPDDIVVSADDDTIMNFLKTKSGRKTLEDLNSWLSDNEVYLLVWRQPVTGPYVATIKKISFVLDRGHGNVAFLHPITVYGEKQADHDGDTVGYSILYRPDETGRSFRSPILTNAMVNKREEFKEKLVTIRIEFFDKPDQPQEYTSFRNVARLTNQYMRRLYSQAVSTNAKSLLGVLREKEMVITIGDTEYRARNKNELSIMRYSPMKDEITQEMVEEVKMGTLVNKNGQPWEEGDGKKYLKTDVDTELDIIQQAAVDHAKELYLAYWNSDKTLYEFIFNRMIVKDDGSMVTDDKVISTISTNLRKFIQSGTDRQGVDINHNKKDMTEIFKSSQDMYSFNNSNAVERGQLLTDKANVYRTDRSNRKRYTYPIESISMNYTRLETQ